MRIFISYAARDGDLAKRIVDFLHENRIEVFSHNLRISLGDDLFHRLQSILQHPNHILVLLSKSYLRDEWLKKELHALVTNELTTNSHGLVVPLSIDDAPIPSHSPVRTLRGFEQRLLAVDEQTFTRDNSDLLKRVLAQFSAPRRVFVVMEFNDAELDSAYESVMKKIITEFGYVPIRMDKIHVSRGITDHILSEIEQSEMVLAEMSGEKPNCYYEAGYAHALNKEIIFTNFKSSPIAFNLQNLQFIHWATEEELERKLRERFGDLRGVGLSKSAHNVQT